MTAISCELCTIDIVNELPQKLLLCPSCALYPIFGVVRVAGSARIHRSHHRWGHASLPVPSMETDEAMSRLRTMGALPTVKAGLKIKLADIGPETVFCTSGAVTGSIYMTIAYEMLIVALEYVPWGTFINESGCMVPIKVHHFHGRRRRYNRDGATSCVGQRH